MHGDSLCCGSIYGQEKNVTNAAIAKMNLFLHGASDFQIMQGDTLRNPLILAGDQLARFDCVIANPPFSLEKWGSVEWASDRYGRNLWGTPPDSCGDYAWIQHMVCSMKYGTGRLAVVLPQGVLFRGGQEGEIRRQLIQSDLVEAVVTLGDKLFYGTGLSPCFLILRQNKSLDHTHRVLMIDATKILTPKRAQNVMTDEDVARIYQLYADYQDVEDYSRVVAYDELQQKDFNLSPNRYVQYHREEVEPYEAVKERFLQAYEDVLEAEKKFRDIIGPMEPQQLTLPF